jgi:acyl carrier protein|uniref:Acyl carrier protein n=1 Tax=Panagrolaimus sp. PS1159 TaxID=55785 RepID=A0AC35EXX3_9BILA
MLPRFGAAPGVRFVSSIISQRLRHVSAPTLQKSVSKLSGPSSSQLQQKRHGTISVFGPFDPPKQLTFQQVEERVLKAVKAWDRFPQDRVNLLSMEARFIEDLGFDSLDHVEIIMALEDEFGFEIPDKDAERLKTPRDVFKYICEREDVYE